MVQRLVYRRRLSYNTRSNKVRPVKTPGGRLVYHYLKKKAATPKCGDCHASLNGIPALRPRKYGALSKRQKKVYRVYGGSRCGKCTRERILRAFLLEERKIVKAVFKMRAKGVISAVATPAAAAAAALTAKKTTKTTPKTGAAASKKPAAKSASGAAQKSDKKAVAPKKK